MKLVEIDRPKTKQLYFDNGYYVTVVTQKDNDQDNGMELLDFYLGHVAYGDWHYMFGMFKKDVAKHGIIDLIMSNIEPHIDMFEMDIADHNV